MLESLTRKELIIMPQIIVCEWRMIFSVKDPCLLGLVDAFYLKTLLLLHYYLLQVVAARLIIEKDSRIVGTQGLQ